MGYNNVQSMDGGWKGWLDAGLPIARDYQSPSEALIEKRLAGAEGFEPSPSSLTVRCPTSWTTPQRAVFVPDLSGDAPLLGRLRRNKSVEVSFQDTTEARPANASK